MCSSLLDFILSLFFRRRPRPDYDRMDPPQAQQAVNAAIVNETIQQTVASAQLAGGRTSAQLRTQAANAAQRNNEANSKRTMGEATIAQFQQALQNCMSGAAELGKWIDKQVSAQLAALGDALNIPKMFEEFKRLSPLLKLLVVVGLLGLLYLLHRLSWEAISYVWPSIMEFVHSDGARTLIKELTGFLTFLETSGVIKKFTDVFGSAVEASKSDTEEEPCFEMTLWKELETATQNKGQGNFLFAILNALFASLATSVMIGMK